MTSGLTFRLFRIPIRLSVWFFAIVVLINIQRLGPFARSPLPVTLDFLLGVVATGMVLIVHELGHCAAYRRFGQEPSVMMTGLLNHTYGTGPLPPSRKLLVALAGNGVSLLVLALPAFLLGTYVIPGSPIGIGAPTLDEIPASFLSNLLSFTLFWSVVNVLPILPLDGGHVVEAVLEWVHGEPQKQTARLVSGVAGIGFGIIALLVFFQPFWMLILVVLGVLNLLPWHQERSGQPVRSYLPDDDTPMGFGGGGPEPNVVSMDKARKKRDRRSPAELVKAGYEALERREYKAALRMSDRLQGKRLNNELDRWTAELAAFAWLGERNPVKAQEVMATLPRGLQVSTPLAAVLAMADKRTDEAMRLMVRCMVNEPEGGPKLIAVDLFAEYGMIHRLARDLVDQPGGAGFEAAVSLEGMLHRLHRTQDATTVSDVILLG